MKESTDLELAQGMLVDAVERVLSRANDETTQQLRMAELRAAFFAHESARRLKELQDYHASVILNALNAQNETRARLVVERQRDHLRLALEAIATAHCTTAEEWQAQIKRSRAALDWCPDS